MKASSAALLMWSVLWFPPSNGAAAADYASHPPMRPLASPVDRPLPDDATMRFVDPKAGNDSQTGSLQAPWKTLQHAVDAAEPGMVIVLRGGVYHETVTAGIRGSAEKPVIIRSHPGELAVLDGGFPEFLDQPATAWEPVPDGAPGEFRSVNSYLETVMGQTSVDEGDGDGEVHLLGHFADSMVPLHGYRFLSDLRAENEYFAALEGAKTAEDKAGGIYCGPGLWFDPQTGRIHVRLAHTSQTCLTESENYAGETDPRKMPLIVTGGIRSPLLLKGAAHVILQDLVFRGARGASVEIVSGSNITLDGVTAYGGASALRVESTAGLRCLNSVFRGIAAPWTWRGSLKYRSIEARIISASSWNIPARPNRDFEFAGCEFTDCVDGVFVGSVDGVDIHHCLLDHISDDGIFVTAATAYDGSTIGGPIRIHENLLSRCLTTFAFGVGHGRQKTIDEAGNKQLGDGIWIYRNVFDFRKPVFYQQPPEGQKEILTYGRTTGDHGGPGWETMFVYQNTILSAEAPWRNYYAAGWGSAMGKGTQRALFNNIFYHFTGLPGEVFAEGEVDLRADGNLHWSSEAGATGAEAFLKRHRSSPAFEKTRRAATDRYADPGFVAAPREGALDLHSRNDDLAGLAVEVPADWPDPYRGDGGVGAIPAGEKNTPWRIGVRGRLDVFGNAQSEPMVATQTASLSPFQYPAKLPPTRRAAIVSGYPAFDAPVVEYALEIAGFAVDHFEKTWLPGADYSKYEIVVVNGDLVRAKMEPSRYLAADLSAVGAWLSSGGTLVAMRGNIAQLFASDEGKAAWKHLAGEVPKDTAFEPSLLQPEHPWLKPLGIDSGATLPWMKEKNVAPIGILPGKGENLIGDPSGKSLLARIPAGKGAVIPIGWFIGTAVPEGRKPSTVEQEAAYEAQYRILEAIFSEIIATPR